jgi:2-iminobutanoate/2-iminopropanoate deaminase
MDVSQGARSVPPGGHYSPSLRAGDFLFVAGQTPRDGERRIIGSTIEEQTLATLENIRMILERVDATIQQIVKVTVYLADMNDAPKFNAEYAKYFADHKPPRTTVGVQLNGVLIEIDAIAYLGKGP